MNWQVPVMRFYSWKNDRKRDRGLSVPENVERLTNQTYGPYGKDNLLDIYYPKGTEGPIPVILSIHGGGYVYGDKDLYQYYCMNLCQRGFAVVNINYRLAPKWKYPAPLEDVNTALKWLVMQAKNLDLKNVFIVGDSAGAQIACQYALILTNQRYAGLFDFEALAGENLTLRALGLNCGIYSVEGVIASKNSLLEGLLLAYCGSDIQEKWGEQLEPRHFFDKNFPPSFIVTAVNDFLREQAAPLGQHLTAAGVENQVKVYGSAEEKDIGHVFHLNIRNDIAKQCNDEETAFFKKHIV
ncbi:MAG: alpha/beta hydrolase [Spirochaetaceae bacterium]|jgi:acetyl esterase/lipase|nr:alpha/beta hydrolase [Spirochaetaceae bacterium]